MDEDGLGMTSYESVYRDTTRNPADLAGPYHGLQSGDITSLRFTQRCLHSDFAR